MRFKAALASPLDLREVGDAVDRPGKSGEQAKAHAVDSLKAAGEARDRDRDPAARGYGAAEQKLGEVTGCGGMQNEGAASKKSEEAASS